MNKKNIYTVTIIGLGNIGLLYDIDRDSDSKEFLSHTRSAFFHKNFEIKYLVDKDLSKLELAKNKFGNQIEYKTELGVDYIPTEIIVLASIPSVNAHYLNKLKSIDNVKLFLIEKPFLNQLETISNYKKIIKKSYVNYFRKSIPYFKNLKKDIDKKIFGNLIAVNVYYSKGLSNNGSHLIDLINYFFGPNYDLDSIKIINYKNDYSIDDESVSFCIDYNYNEKSIPVIFNSLDERKFSLIELDLFFDSQRFRIFDFGGKIEISKIFQDKVFSGYKNLLPSEVIDSNINSYGMYTYDTIENILNGDEENHSTLKEENDIKVLKDAVLNKLNKYKK